MGVRWLAQVHAGPDNNGVEKKGHIVVSEHTQVVCEGMKLRILNLDRVWGLTGDSVQQVGSWASRHVAPSSAVCYSVPLYTHRPHVHPPPPCSTASPL